MEGYLVAVLIGILIGYSLGNKKFRRRVSNMIGSFREEDDYDYEDEEDDD